MDTAGRDRGTLAPTEAETDNRQKPERTNMLKTRVASIKADKKTRLSMKEMISRPGVYTTSRSSQRHNGVKDEYMISLRHLDGLLYTFYSIDDDRTYTYVLDSTQDNIKSVYGYEADDGVIIEFVNNKG